VLGGIRKRRAKQPEGVRVDLHAIQSVIPRNEEGVEIATDIAADFQDSGVLRGHDLADEGHQERAPGGSFDILDRAVRFVPWTSPIPPDHARS
jgi:hypothetical protein